MNIDCQDEAFFVIYNKRILLRKQHTYKTSYKKTRNNTHRRDFTLVKN